MSSLSRKIRKATPKEVDGFWDDRFDNRADDGVLFICEEALDHTRIPPDDIEELNEFVFDDVQFTPIPKGICTTLWDIIKEEEITEPVQVIYLAPLMNIEYTHPEDELGYTLVEDRNVAKTYGIGWEGEDDPKEIVIALDHPLFTEKGLDDTEQMIKHALVSTFHEEGHFRAYYEEGFCDFEEESEEEECVEQYGENRTETVLRKSGLELYFGWD